jgi:helix-turn-helix protein
MSGPKRGPRSALVVNLTTEQCAELERWRRSMTMPVSLVRRAIGMLRLAAGASVTEAAAAAQMQRKYLRAWARRFAEHGVAGLHDSPGRGRKSVFSPGGCRACGEDRLRTAGHAGAVALAVG